ncbi:MAG: hydrogenase maturation protease [Bryobacterales bacterium]|nr:hydrogenase maturation protease [Bryobacteraceae bacterium]MDW8353719.1 hydrogenase maturation protease [Bryobacterales bacterium]
MKSPLVIGCGAEGRGDDVAGLLVARRLRALGVEAIEHRGDALALLESWNEAGAEREVVLVDAVVTGAPVGTVTVWDARSVPVLGDFFRCSTHAFGVAEAVELARRLDRLPPRMRIYGIEGERFGRGQEPSQPVLEAVERVVWDLASSVVCGAADG